MAPDRCLWCYKPIMEGEEIKHILKALLGKEETVHAKCNLIMNNRVDFIFDCPLCKAHISVTHEFGLEGPVRDFVTWHPTPNPKETCGLSNLTVEANGHIDGTSFTIEGWSEVLEREKDGKKQ